MYKYRGVPGKLPARFRSDMTFERQGRTNPVALRFPFNPPGSSARPVPIEDGQGFDMVRCTVAAYFHKARSSFA